MSILAKKYCRCLNRVKQLRFGWCCASRPINEVNGNEERERSTVVRVEISKMSRHVDFCQIKKSKRITRRPVEVLKLGLNHASLWTTTEMVCNEGNHDPLSVVLFFFSFCFLLNVVIVWKCRLMHRVQKSMHRLPCHIYVFHVITREH